MKDLLDAIDRADPWTLVAAALGWLWLLTELQLRWTRCSPARRP